MIVNNSLPLAGWRLSGNASLQRAYRNKLQIFSSLPNVDQQMLSTSPVGLSGCGWSRQRQIDPFCPAVSDLVHFLTELFEQDLEFMQYLPEGVEFRIPGLTKTRVPGKDVIFFFPALKGNVQLCPVACLREYIRDGDGDRK
ncbi:hypothetical protein OS493_025236 [Desmophyllum pertusum]|uniref:Uncharacterized protein n=1 Tax=Desmophyllum pertusum TaxID=174260 RepID=A0A9X0D3W6_9CNID|nr:hypothetical protein OS493_025236 [Desmophyllum pertusum]